MVISTYHLGNRNWCLKCTYSLSKEGIKNLSKEGMFSSLTPTESHRFWKIMEYQQLVTQAAFTNRDSMTSWAETVYISLLKKKNKEETP